MNATDILDANVALLQSKARFATREFPAVCDASDSRRAGVLVSPVLLVAAQRRSLSSITCSSVPLGIATSEGTGEVASTADLAPS